MPAEVDAYINASLKKHNEKWLHEMSIKLKMNCIFVSIQ